MVLSRILRPKILSLRLFLSSQPPLHPSNPSSYPPLPRYPHSTASPFDGQPWVPRRPVRNVDINSRTLYHAFLTSFLLPFLDKRVEISGLESANMNLIFLLSLCSVVRFLELMLFLWSLNFNKISMDCRYVK